MKMLADAGQYSITTSIMHKPWNGQTEDHYDSMVTRIKHIDGSWTFDYAVFDRYVDFMMNDVGIPMKDMQAAIKVIKDADKDYKISLAGIYHEEIERDLYYYCIAYGHDFPQDVLARRRAEGKISTYYTCCTEGFPNTFTFSPPAEAAWMAVHVSAHGLPATPIASIPVRAQASVSSV